MRLITVKVSGVGRLVDVSMNVDSKLIAVVGPNEAGKTTLLRALRFLTTGGHLALTERSRAGRTITDDSEVVSATFVLDAADRAVLDPSTVEELPNRMTWSRRANASQSIVNITPRPQRPRAGLREAVTALLEALTNESELRRRIAPATVWSSEDGVPERDFFEEIRSLLSATDAVLQGRNRLAVDADDQRTSAGELAEAMSPVGDDLARRVRQALQQIQDWVDVPDPEPILRQALFDRRPTFLLFGEAERDLRSSYPADESLVSAPPTAIGNLATVAGLGLHALVEAINAADVSRRETALRRANRVLSEFFTTVWTQSALTVELSIDGDQLLVNIVENDDAVTAFDERSSGLRAFIALVTFLRARAVTGEVVLLIDEAENHLHIDAQVDLVNMLEQQEEASRVIYTTHSPACLPLDLGRSVRAILPSGRSDQTSRVSNSFWTEPGPGFSPLLVAMGAGAAAFSVARRVVLGEGATEMLLLPSLLRSADPGQPIVFQVAPGLAETPASFYDALDLQGARVAYLVDGDAAGDHLRSGLVERGIPQRSVVQLPMPTLEQFIEPTEYLTAVRELASEALGGIDIPDLPVLSTAEPWAAQVEGWLSSYGARAPSKVAVANRLLETDRAVVAPQHLEAARQLRAALDEALGPPGRGRTR